MKLLLTSGGLRNKSMVAALHEMIGQSFDKVNLVFIPTAANVETGDKGWLIEDQNRFIRLGFKEFDIVDIAALRTRKKIWLSRLERADVIVVGGGNTSYLMEQIRHSGLAFELPKLLETRVYVGISAGSMVVSSDLKEKEMQVLYEEPIFTTRGFTAKGLGFVDFLVVPHLKSPHFPRVSELINEVARGIGITLYALDDESAVKVVDGQVEVVSEGEFKKYN